VKIITGDARKLEVESNSVDLIVTSLPYVNAFYIIICFGWEWILIYSENMRLELIPILLSL